MILLSSQAGFSADGAGESGLPAEGTVALFDTFWKFIFSLNLA